MKREALELFQKNFGSPRRDVSKVTAWELPSGVGLVVQKDGPKGDNIVYVWLPHPGDGMTIPEIASEYPEEMGRHSGTYASSGLKKRLPALRLTVSSEEELQQTLAYIKAFESQSPLPEVLRTETLAIPLAQRIERPRREGIPREVQREVWRRDLGMCVDCSSNEKLEYDHIIPFSRGGSNTVRNIQLLCESCNWSKGNRI